MKRMLWREQWTNFRHGLARRRGEHFTVFIASATTGKVAEIKAPKLSYYADPFVWQAEGQTYLLCEEFRYPRNKAHLRWISLDSDLRPIASQVIATGAGHASFPFLVEDRGTLYLIPETCEEGGIHLWRSDNFPSQWTQLRTLVSGIDAVDTVAFKHDRYWWLITSIRAPNHAGRYLAVYFSDSLLSDAWQAHPINDRMLYRGLPNDSARNAGPLVRWGDRMLRPSQHNSTYYGESIRWMEITKLTETDYNERPLHNAHPLAQFSARFSMHHFAIHGDVVAWDLRDRFWSGKMDARAKATRELPARPLDRDLASFVRGLRDFPIAGPAQGQN